MSVEAGERPAPGADPADAAGTQAQAGAVLDAGIRLFAASRRVVTAELALLAAEARVLRASVAIVFVAGVVLVAFSVALWVCVVALIGWGVAVAAHSVGIALGVLVVLHLILVGAVWVVMKRAVRQAGFPQARAEFAALGRTLRHDLDRFGHAAPPPKEPSP